MTVGDARDQLGDAVALYLDGGRAPGGVASTIVDATGEQLRVVRVGALDLTTLRSVVEVVDGAEGTESTEGTEAGEAG
jgi:tRNA A37 threonylcarbamoyladenosine synthetase subunit TsaC/SUA5/YrdC